MFCSKQYILHTLNLHFVALDVHLDESPVYLALLDVYFDPAKVEIGCPTVKADKITRLSSARSQDFMRIFEGVHFYNDTVSILPSN